MAATTTGMQMMQVQQAAALLLCLVVLAASTRVALGNCRDDCMAACNGWTIVCQLSCASACYGEVALRGFKLSSPTTRGRG
ncbi:hypothetical protein ZEAMMB73_Zm00001d012799 [Zea mays]|uniref:Uncharacterized protein n=1 Tax=Zea mays TaxID=4577 RepID=A0A1D6GCK8_MAIZE|nr:hypothetical protein ZEAMMB73_Zm00001d012799 [Zea mays]